MHTQDQHRAESNLSLYRRLFKIKRALRLSAQEWVNLLGITIHEAQQLDYGKKDIKILAIFNLSEKLNINIDDLLLGKYDLKALKEHHHGNDCYIPQKYTVGAGSYCRSIINHLDFIEMYHGEDIKNELMAKLQIKEKGLYDKERKVNLKLIKDITKFLRSFKYQSEDFYRLGKFTAITYQNTPIGNELSNLNCQKKLYTRIMEIQNVYEENYNYKITTLNEHTCIIEGRPREEKQEALQSKNISNRDIELIKAGLLASSPNFLGKPNSKVKLNFKTVKNRLVSEFTISYN